MSSLRKQENSKVQLKCHFKSVQRIEWVVHSNVHPFVYVFACLLLREKSDLVESYIP